MTKRIRHPLTERPWRFMGLASTVLAMAALSLPGRQAAASEPAGTYTIPSGVDLLPDADHPTEVILHGIFFQLLASGRYSDPQCGRMHFVCASGQSDMCTMQWRELKEAARVASSTLCYGFGAISRVSTAAVTPEGGPLGAADTWDLGIGITTGLYVDGKCLPAHALRCAGDASGGAGGASQGGGGAGGQPSRTGGVGGGPASTGGGASTGGAASGGASGAGGLSVQGGAGGETSASGGGAGNAPTGGLGAHGGLALTGGAVATGGGSAGSPGVASGCQLEGGAPELLASGILGVMTCFARARRNAVRKRTQ